MQRVLGIEHTTADLAGEDRTSPHTVAEAIGYRGDTATNS
jgi:predicted ATPase with chaperone activity